MSDSTKRKVGIVDDDVQIDTVRDPKTGAAVGTRLVKKAKIDGQLVTLTNQGAVIVHNSAGGPARTSSLMAPTLNLIGHKAEIFCVKFNAAGDFIASGSKDKTVLLWNTYGECENWGMLTGHNDAILDLQWSRDGDMLFTASADKTGAVWDVDLQTRLKKLKEHTGIVNSVCPARRGDPLLLSASDDCSTLLWDIRCRKSIGTFSSEYQVFSSVFSDDSSCMFQAGLEGVVRMWDLRKHEVVFELTGHTDAITSMQLSPNGHSLLTHSQDNSVMAWDVRPFMSAAAKTRQIGTYYGAKHDFQQNLLGVSWSSDGSRISAGSADGLVYIWDAKSQQVIYRLPGHQGCVNAVDFHPTEPIIVSAGSDKLMYLGEIETQE